MPHTTPLGRRAAAAALAIVVGLTGVAACGDDSTTTAAGDDTTSTLGTDGDESTTTTARSTETSGRTPSGSSGSFCAEITAFDEMLDSLDDIYDSDVPEDLADGFRAVLPSMLAVNPPAEIEADWAVMVAAFGNSAGSLDRIDYSRDDVEEQFDAVGEALAKEFADVDDAADRVEDYVLAECDIDLGA